MKGHFAAEVCPRASWVDILVTKAYFYTNLDLFSFCSGLSQESGSVEQISLHCAEGSLEWLYPTGALRLSLSPRLPTGTAGKGKSPRQVTTCIKPSSTFRGAQIYLERDGILELLLSEADASLRPRVRCFNWLPKEKVALFLQSTLHQDISRRIAAFRYELRGDWNSRLSLPSSNLSMEGKYPRAVPCNGLVGYQAC